MCFPVDNFALCLWVRCGSYTTSCILLQGLTECSVVYNGITLLSWTGAPSSLCWITGLLKTHTIYVLLSDMDATSAAQSGVYSGYCSWEDWPRVHTSYCACASLIRELWHTSTLPLWNNREAAVMGTEWDEVGVYPLLNLYIGDS